MLAPARFAFSAIAMAVAFSCRGARRPPGGMGWPAIMKSTLQLNLSVVVMVVVCVCLCVWGGEGSA